VIYNIHMSSISSYIKKAKENNLSFYVLKGFYKDAPTQLDFKRYISENNIHGDKPDIEKKYFSYFKNWRELIEDLSAIYPDTGSSSLIWTEEKDLSIGGIDIHNDPTDVIHVNCYGRVEWKIIDSCQNEHIVILSPGDILYLKQGVLHQTKPITARGSLIYSI